MTRGVRNPRHWALAARLRRARKAAGLSAAELSRRADVGTYTVASIEAGHRLPRLPVVEAIAAALGTTPGEIAYGLGGAMPERPELGAAALSARLRVARGQQGLTATAVAGAAGLVEGTVRAIEQRGTMPTIDTVEQLAIALGVSPAWLGFGEGPQVLERRRRASSAARAQGYVLSPPNDLERT